MFYSIDLEIKITLLSMCLTLVSNIITYISIHSKVVAYKRRTQRKIINVFIGINKWLDNVVEPKEDPIEKFYKSLGTRSYHSKVKRLFTIDCSK